MKKVLLSLSLLGVTAPQTTQAVTVAEITSALTGDTAKKIALLSIVGSYFFILKKRKPLDSIPADAEWEWSNLINKLGQSNYISEEILGNFQDKTETKVYTKINETTTVKETKKETKVKAYGLIPTLDALIISKLKDFVELIKNIKSLNGFLNDPAAELGFSAEIKAEKIK